MFCFIHDWLHSLTFIGLLKYGSRDFWRPRLWVVRLRKAMNHWISRQHVHLGRNASSTQVINTQHLSRTRTQGRYGVWCIFLTYFVYTFGGVALWTTTLTVYSNGIQYLWVFVKCVLSRYMNSCKIACSQNIYIRALVAVSLFPSLPDNIDPDRIVFRPASRVDLSRLESTWTFQAGSSRSVVASPSKFYGAVGLIASHFKSTWLINLHLAVLSYKYTQLWMSNL